MPGADEVEPVVTHPHDDHLSNSGLKHHLDDQLEHGDGLHRLELRNAAHSYPNDAAV